jgi:aspartate/methionine/tyrosine aminotransferase
VNNTYCFGWGEGYCVREALKHYYKRKSYRPINIKGLGYAADEGDPELIEYTRQFIKENTGIDYKYIIITNGTTGALNVVLRALAKNESKDLCYTHKYCFPYYPHIVEKNGYEHLTGLYKNHESQLAREGAVGIVDSPSNPEGDLLLYSDHKNNIIWDSVYHNDVFLNTIPVKPDHRVNCGSYSKCFGLTGVRVGWIATNSKSDYEMFKKENLYETCTISVPSQELMKDILTNTDLDKFMTSARYRVNNNREMFDRIVYLFDGQAVPENGMFYVAWASPYVQKLLDKLGILSVQMDQQGKDKFLRFNLAQTNDITNKAIKYIIKEDTRDLR